MTQRKRPKTNNRPRRPRLAARAWVMPDGNEVAAYAFTVKETCIVDPRSTEDGFHSVNPLTYYGITEEETRALDAANLKRLGFVPRFGWAEDVPDNPPRSGHLARWLHEWQSAIARYSYGGYTLVYEAAKRIVRITHHETKSRHTTKTFRAAERYVDTLLSTKIRKKR